jgi:GNAT superfamily N-acetyltransferase
VTQADTHFILRRATAADAKALHAQVVATYVPWVGRLPEARVFEETLGDVEASLAAWPIWVITHDETIIASARADANTDATGDRWVEVHRVAVLPEWAGQGLGKRLMNAIEEWALSLDPLRPYPIELEVRVAQPISQQFYAGLGFVQIDIGARHRDGTPRTLRLRKEVLAGA